MLVNTSLTLPVPPDAGVLIPATSALVHVNVDPPVALDAR